jgi:hypothetical protein
MKRSAFLIQQPGVVYRLRALQEETKLITGLTIRRVIEDVDSADVMEYNQTRNRQGFLKDMIRQKYGFATPHRVLLASVAMREVAATYGLH